MRCEIFIGALVGAFAFSIDRSDTYGVIFDCGSSGTRAHYYKWPDDRSEDIVDIEEVSEKISPKISKTPEKSIKVEPGISNFGQSQYCIGGQDTDLVCNKIKVDPDHPGCDKADYKWYDTKSDTSCPDIKGTSTSEDCCLDIDDYIMPLLDQANRWVPGNKWSSAKLRMHATAGMRLLDSSMQEAIWVKLSEAARSNTIITLTDAYTLGGNYEGLFGWLAVQQANKWKKTTKGWLDLGGASTQIAFAPPDDVILEDAYRVETVKEGRKGFEGLQWSRVYAISYMRAGQDQGQDRMAQFVYDKNKHVGGAGEKPIDHPCFNQGYNPELRVCNSNCRNYETAKTHKQKFTGTGNYTKCHLYVEEALIHPEYECLQEPCAVAGRYQPKVGEMTFIAGSAFYYLVSALFPNTTAPITDISADQIGEAGKDFCKTKWSDVPNVYGPDAAQYGQNYCFSSAYVPAMFDRYGIGGDSKAITYASSLSGYDMEWTLGAQIYYNSASGCTKITPVSKTIK